MPGVTVGVNSCRPHVYLAENGSFCSFPSSQSAGQGLEGSLLVMTMSRSGGIISPSEQ